jgi:hypothetical protein
VPTSIRPFRRTALNSLHAPRHTRDLSSAALLLLALGFVAAHPAAAQSYADASTQPTAEVQTDPPDRVARIAIIQGNVSLEPAGVDTFSQAELNYPLTVGDRVYVDLQGLAELQTAGLAVRMGNAADITLASLSDQVAQFGLAQGSIRVSTHDLLAPANTAAVVEIDTPNGSVLVQQPGDIRVDSYPQSDTTVVTVTSGQVEVTGPQLAQMVGPGQSLRLSGSNPVAAQFVGLLEQDNLDHFDADRESLFAGAVNADDQYVSPDMIGASDLNQYGDWAASDDYGEVWYPRAIAVGWVPYHNGHWAWVAPWGWTWVEAEPWGFAPFHYGRWAFVGTRWGWIPGPPPLLYGHPVRPIYSPALVAFVGGPSVSVALGFGGAAGAGITAWFPLGPNEPYVPWYHASTAYVNRVNVTNLYNRNPAQVRAQYANRLTPLFVANATDVYANRTVALTAVSQRDFAAGRSVARSQPLALDANTRAQLSNAPVLPHPMVTPGDTIAAPQTPARSVPPSSARPIVGTRSGFGNSGALTAGSVAHPEPPQSAPATQMARPTPSYPQQRDHQAVTPGTQPATVTPRPADQPRTLINRTEPQPTQPSFHEQQQAIEHTDPGRPLGPQQVQNLRSGRPAGAPSQPEAQHPAPAARPAPPPPARPKP